MPNDGNGTRSFSRRQEDDPPNKAAPAETKTEFLTHMADEQNLPREPHRTVCRPDGSEKGQQTANEKTSNIAINAPKKAKPLTKEALTPKNNASVAPTLAPPDTPNT